MVGVLCLLFRAGDGGDHAGDGDGDGDLFVECADDVEAVPSEVGCGDESGGGYSAGAGDSDAG